MLSAMPLPKIYTNENAARKHLERLLWPDGPTCPHCGNADPKRIHKLAGKSTRPGVHKCRECEKPFSVTVGTVFESSHIPLHKWVYASHLLTSSKKGISSHQLMRMLGVAYRTAWFMSHRIREAMRDGELAPMGGSGGPVEVDETFIGRIKGVPVGGAAHKNIVLTLVDRGSGQARIFKIDSTSIAGIAPIVRTNIRREAGLMTDEALHYKALGKEYATHGTVVHTREEYARGAIHTNTVEGYFSIFKRGMKGVYQHCSEKHLHRYLAEFDFRYSNRIALGIDDAMRADRALKGGAGKRLMYGRPN
jgi:transposase-like protein